VFCVNLIPNLNAELDSLTALVSHHHVVVNGVCIHYVQAGQGKPVVLLAGWPQTWYAWRRVIPTLAQRYTVIALDMRGLGDSDKPETGYDTQTIASDIQAVVQQLGWQTIHLVGHDVGAWAAYAYAAIYPDQVSHLAVLDAAIPGITPAQAFQLTPGSKTWQFSFHTVPDLPEALTEGRERLYLSWFFRTKAVQASAISEDDIDEYVRCYSAPVFDDIAQNQAFAQINLPMPVLALGGEAATGMRMLQTLQTVAENVQGGVVPNCGHYIPEEQPEYLTAELLSFFGEQQP
jgi:pimeloyl-ACP methyl ester carboxylesterase